ncbi:MAG TPA: amino acid adenylation domain-containing protein, partial [Thermoanaerobaculia bacterium]
MPADRPRPAVAREAGGSVKVALVDPEIRERLAALGREHRATPFMVVAALFQALLGRLAGQTDFAVGTPVANRHRTETEGLIGFFVNTLALRADLAGDPTVRELLRRTQRTVSQAFAHGQVPWSRVVEALNPERSLARSPIFQAFFSYGNLGTPALAIPGLASRPLQEAEEVSLYDLGLTWAEEGRGIDADLEYRADLFDRATAQRMVRQLATLALCALADPDRRLSLLPLLDAAERFQLLAEWAGEREVDAEPLAPLPARFLAWARQAPERPALVAGAAGLERLTYGELAARADRLARNLRRLGVGPEVRVAVRLPRTADLVVALLGVLAAGGAYVPIDPAYPEERQAFLVKDSGARLAIAESPLPGGEALPLVRPDEAEESAAPLPARPVDLQNLAYVIYTSGSTGTPKGVAVAHGGAAARLAWAARAFSAAELAGVLAATSVCFDLSVFELFAPLAAGGRVILAENALALPRLAAASAVTLVNTVPSAMAELVRGGALPRTLAAVNLAGEPLPPPLAAAIFAAVPGVRLTNLYGPSEDTTYSTASQLVAGSGAVPIGRPLPGTRAYVLDVAGELAPPGVPGELHLGGVGLARGYLDRPELTASRFVPDPFGGEPGERLYRTGDLVRRRSDGALLFLRRLDDQVKVRGFRIELGEVEAALVAEAGVREAAVAVRDGREESAGDRRLVAYVVMEEGSDGEAAVRLRDRLRRRLPEALVPSAVHTVAALPRNANGKLDRKALLALDVGREGAGRAFSPQLTPTEEIVAGIWAEVLGPAALPVSRDAGFFDLGGHSLLATQVGYRLREVFGVDLPLARLFGGASLADLARDVDRARQGEGARVAPPIVRQPRDRPLPASYYQQWFWDLQGGTPVSAFF